MGRARARRPKRESLIVLLAQWALETGRGHSMHCFNIGNIKGRPGGTDGHDWVFFRCNEVLKGKIVWFDPPDPGCCFRAYDNLELGARDYLALLRKRFSKAWPAVIIGDPAAFSHALKAQGYYTASEGLYTRSLVSIFKEFLLTTKPDLPDLHTISGVQFALNMLGANPTLKVDGVAGEKTRAAVRAFQLEHGLVADGIAGPKTQAAIAGLLPAATESS